MIKDGVKDPPRYGKPLVSSTPDQSFKGTKATGRGAGEARNRFLQTAHSMVLDRSSAESCISRWQPGQLTAGIGRTPEGDANFPADTKEKQVKCVGRRQMVQAPVRSDANNEFAAERQASPRGANGGGSAPG